MLHAFGIFALLFLATWQGADASHHAYATINWVRDKDVPYNFIVTIDMALRTGFCGTANIVVGSPATCSTSPLIRIAYQPEKCGKPACTACAWAAATPFTNDPDYPPQKCTLTGQNIYFETNNFGTTATTNAFVVLQKYVSDDYFVMRCVKNITLPPVSSGSWNGRTSRWWLFVHAYARIDVLGSVKTVDGNDGGMLSMELDTILDPRYLNSPVSFGYPRETVLNFCFQHSVFVSPGLSHICPPSVQAAVGITWTFDMSKQSRSPSQLKLNYTIPPGRNGNVNPVSPNSALANPLPGSRTPSTTSPKPLNLTKYNFKDTGIIEWVPVLEGFYMLQVWITDSNGIFVPIDFILQVIKLC
jgi:hypothetical protein